MQIIFLVSQTKAVLYSIQNTGRLAMRRKDREIKDFETIRQIIDSCEIINLGLFDPDDPDFPYIVPVNFGYTTDENNNIDFYIHGANTGRKFELMQNNRKCSFVMYCDSYIELIPDAKDVTSRYKCVMGKAEVSLLESEDMITGLQCMMDRREDTRNFDWNRGSIPRVAVWRLRVTELSAKANISK